MPLPEDVLVGKSPLPPRPPKEPRPRIRTEWIVGLAALLLISLAVLLLYLRLSGVEESVARVESGMQETRESIAAAVKELELANRRAAEAETFAREAETARQLAQQQAAEATTDRELARQRAEEAEQQAAEARREADAVRREAEQQLQRLEENLGRITDTRRTALGLVMNLSSDALRFEFDKARLSGQGRELLSRIAGILLTLPEGYGVYVYGHTDDVGDAAYNLGLSERRARAVRDYLVSAGIAPELITTKGFGKSQPLVQGSDAAARAQNRRVEIGVINTDVRYVEAVDPERIP